MAELTHDEILKHISDVTADPATGERKVELSALDPEIRDQVIPYIIGEKVMPDVDESYEEPPADTSAADAEAEAEAARMAAEQAARTTTQTAPTEKREVAAARSAIERAAARKEKFNGLLAAQDAILDEVEPDMDLDPAEWRTWNNRQKAALREHGRITRDYTDSRDVEDASESAAFIARSEDAETIRSIGDEFEHLKLPKDFDVLHSDYNVWGARAMAEAGTDDTNVAFQKYHNDPEFAKKVGPLPEGWETLFVYLHAIARQKAKGGDLEGHVLSEARKAGLLKKSVTTAADKARLEQARLTDAALNKRATEAKPAGVQAGGTEAPKTVGRPLPGNKESARDTLLHINKSRRNGDWQKMSNSEREKWEQYESEAHGILDPNAVANAPMRA